MKFYGNAVFQDASKVRMYTLASLPVSGAEGDLVLVGDRVYIAIDNTPTWVQLTNVTDYFVHTQTPASASWTVTHNLNTLNVIVQIFDSSNNVILPDTIVATSANVVTVTFNTAVEGKAVVLTGDSNGVASGTPSTLYDIGGSTLTQPTNAAVLMRFVAVRSYQLPASLTGSYAISATAPTGTPAYPIKKNGSSIGTINYSSNSGTFTFASAVSFAAGDVLTVEAPATADATHDGLAWTFKGVLL